jgi:maltodextrin utilization protein YvdJ
MKNKNLLNLKSKRSQEEMVGFALIIIIVSVILLVFLGFSLRGEQKESVESYEVESFIQSFLQYTTECKASNLEYLTIQKLIFYCDEKRECSDGKNTCEVLKSNLKGIIEESWKVEEGSVVKGYELKIDKENSEILLIEKGDKTNNYKSSMQTFARSGKSYHILFTGYY